MSKAPIDTRTFVLPKPDNPRSLSHALGTLLNLNMGRLPRAEYLGEGDRAKDAPPALQVAAEGECMTIQTPVSGPWFIQYFWREQINAWVKEWLPHAHVEIEKVTVSERSAQ